MFNFKRAHVFSFLFLAYFGFNLNQLNAASRVFYPDNIVLTERDEFSFVKDLEKDQKIVSSTTTVFDDSSKTKIYKINVGKPNFSKAALIELKSSDGRVGSLVVADKLYFCKHGSFLKKELGIKEKENIFFGKNWISVSDFKVGDKIKGFSDEILMVNKIDFFDVDQDGLFYELDLFGDFYLVDSVGHKVLCLSTSEVIYENIIVAFALVGIGLMHLGAALVVNLY